MTNETLECTPSAMDGNLRAWDRRTIMSQWEDAAIYLGQFVTEGNRAATLAAWKVRLLEGSSTLFVFEQGGFINGAILVTLGFRPGDGVLFIENFAIDGSKLNQRTRKHISDTLQDYAVMNGCKVILGLTPNRELCKQLQSFGYVSEMVFSVRKEL